MGARGGSNRRRHLPLSLLKCCHVAQLCACVCMRLSYSAFPQGQSSITALCLACCWYRLHLSRDSFCFGYAKPNIIAYFLQPNVSLCNSVSIELLYSMQKKIISLLKCLCIKHYKFKLGAHGLASDNPGLAQCKVNTDFPLLAKICSVNKNFRNNIIALKRQCK